MSKTGRNDPCPCGSGRKYKVCHLPEIERAARAPRGRMDEVKDADQRLLERIIKYVRQVFGDDSLRAAFEHWPGPRPIDESELQLFVPWSLYHFHLVGEPTALERYMAGPCDTTDVEDDVLCRAQATAGIGIWETEAVQKGVSVQVRDCFTDRRFEVLERKGSTQMLPLHTILARIVEHPDGPFFAGLHPLVLPPRSASEVVSEIKRDILGGRTQPTPQRMRSSSWAEAVIRAWYRAVERLEHRPLPQLVNTDGDPLESAIDKFRFRPGTRSAVLARLTAIEGAELDRTTDGEDTIDVLQAGNPVHTEWSNTHVARIRVGPSTVMVETNSVRRADRLRAIIERAASELLEHVSRVVEDPKKLFTEHSAGRSSSSPPSPPVADPKLAELTRRFKEQHYRAWVDQEIPALGGWTPRRAAASARKRPQLELLLKEMEFNEGRLAEEERFDFSWLRRELGLERAGGGASPAS